ncbi:hypothetical protein GGR53DRAFT_461834 [Hypoxylon sp. FL1150]|nr:hypothetical protein GGR53DRAFT_461834 [Hypoxylon sp. FL1150]
MPGLRCYVDAEAADPEVVDVINYISRATYEVYGNAMIKIALENSTRGMRDRQEPVGPVGLQKHMTRRGGNTKQGNDTEAGSVPTNLVTFAYSPPFNVYHDLLDLLGFTPAAGNFQVDNYGEGGEDNDRVIILIHHYNSKNKGLVGSKPGFWSKM